jgi:mersacidin/lichenicidin family type 2 lantibiotic
LFSTHKSAPWSSQSLLWGEVYQNHKKRRKIVTNQEVVRSWKDEDYLPSLSSRERAFLPDNPAGLAELSDEDLLNVDGGSTPVCYSVAYSLFVCTPYVEASFYVSVVISAATAAWTLS